MRLSDMSQLDELMDETSYDNYVRESEEEWYILPQMQTWT